MKAVVRKAIAIPHLSAIVALRGPSVLVGGLALQIEHTRHSFDDAVEHFAADLRIVAECRPDAELQACLVGWHAAASEPSAYVALSTPHGDAPAFTAMPIAGLISPACEDEDGTDFDIRRKGVALMASQRRAHPGHIGGLCQIVSAYRDRTETRILARWPDRIGEPLNQREDA